nr:cation-transporting P-type ATPase [Desulfobacula sp.]
MDASELVRLDEKELIRRVGAVHVYSRVTPSQKLKIVKAIKASGQTVAMTGDGINDSPALKAADIGIAMGRTGTDLARDVADVVLSRDNIELMAEALADGRCIYQNIRKAVHFSLSTNISEIQLILTALAAGLNSPLNVMQLLWINLISDVLPGLALSAEKPEQDVMEQQPRNPEDPLFSKKDFRGMFIESGTITAGAMGAFLYGISRYGTGAMAGGLAFQALTFGQLFHALSCRSETTGIFTKKKLPRNPYMNWAIGGSLMIQVMSLFLPPLRSLLGLSAITLMDGLVIGAASTMPFLFNEANKAVKETLSLRQGLPGRGGEGDAPDVKEADALKTEDPGGPDLENMAAGFKHFCN